MCGGGGLVGRVVLLLMLMPGFLVGQEAFHEGLLTAVRGGTAMATEGGLRVRRSDGAGAVELLFGRGQVVGVERDAAQWWLLPMAAEGAAGESVSANRLVWVLPVDAGSKDGAWSVELQDGTAEAERTAEGVRVRVTAGTFALRRWAARPRADALGNRFTVRVEGGDGLEEALAGFYWGTMVPSVVERTMAARFPYHDGYVLSTLNTKAYAGSYPAVDHEFQIRGRLAMGSAVDLDVVRRMIELQFQLMRDDPERLSRAPTSVQPDGRREYHIRRSSEDGKTNAGMFPVTGTIEVVEEAWRYYGETKDRLWLQKHIGDLENAAGWTRSHVDEYGRLWSDVYYEDQVMKDGRVTQAQSFAASTFGMMGAMETVLGRTARAARYGEDSKRLARALVEPLPMGYWDAGNGRFVDWVDRNGEVHDHKHLLANVLPVLFGYATAAQAEAVRGFVRENAGEFERFPSFLAADVAGYTRSEIGDGGPYDLSAAGRYWYWDAAYRASEDEGGVLLAQMNAVAGEGAKSGYLMGERYDMDHVYYVDGKDAHGAEKYYEYPNVFAAVLVSKYLGLTVPADADLAVTPRVQGDGTVRMEAPAYAVAYRVGKGEFVLTNLAGRRRRVVVDLRGLPGGAAYRTAGVMGPRFVVEMGPGEERRWAAGR